MISSYKFYNVNLDASLSHKEQLSDTEITSFVYDIAYKKYPTIKVVQDVTKNYCVYTDNGSEYELVYKGKDSK